MNNKKIKRQMNGLMGKNILKMERREGHLTESGKIFVFVGIVHIVPPFFLRFLLC